MHSASGKHLVRSIIPLLNGGKYINRSTESILVQTYEDFELIVIDDRSTDRIGDIITELGDRAGFRSVDHPERQSIARSVNDASADQRPRNQVRMDVRQ